MTQSSAICLFALLTFSSWCWADSSCASEDLQRSVAETKTIRIQLLAAKVGSMDVAVPLTLQRQIRAMKEALAKTVDVYMRCQAKSAKAKQLQNELAVLLGGNAPEKPEEPYRPGNTSLVEDQVYGASLKVAVTKPAKEPQLIAVELSFGIEC